jgi:hypothetical protein
MAKAISLGESRVASENNAAVPLIGISARPSLAAR